MTDSVFSLNRSLGQRLSSLVQDQAACNFPEARRPEPLSVVVTANEVNHLHGTGSLVKRICNGWDDIYSIRARNDFGGIQELGNWNACLHQRARSRPEFFGQVLSLLRGRNISRVLCVPFLKDEFLTAIAIQKSFGAKLCGYLMDDRNIASQAIPDGLMREFLECCSLRLTTHPEMQFAYETKYGLPFHILPAIVPWNLMARESTGLIEPSAGGGRGALIGSFWEQTWFERLTGVLSECNCRIDWFGNNTSHWLRFAPKRLERAGITAHGTIPEDRLAEELKKYPFVMVPVSALEGGESNPGVARLSLPGRILFALATAHTPVLIVGHAHTCGARFVMHFGVGEVAPYDSRRLIEAMDRIRDPERQARMRTRAAEIGPLLSDRGIAGWLAQSIDRGAPADDRFDALFAGYHRTIALPAA
ncbi:MAG TPA: hypothetical protein VNX18_09935 [Bryobacteraceae bacterium]|nr:hypothetical protein [Bryobacteraceae bacterium]